MRHPTRPLAPAAALALALSLVLAVPLPAAADTYTAADGPQQVVRHDDLDLSRDADVQRLYGRIQRAAAAVCPAPAGSVARRAQGYACREETVQRTVEQTNLPRLAELHRGAPRAGHLARR